MGRNIAISALALFLLSCNTASSEFAACASSDIVLMPHHLIVQPYIDEMYEVLTAQRPSKIIIISPDHFYSGSAAISASEEIEHGFTIHRNLALQYFGKLPIEGIMIRINAKENDLIELAEQLSKENALFIFSIDFSHYLDGKIARIHDLMSRDVIESRSIDDAKNLEVDSPGSVEVMLRLLALLDEKMVVYKNTNPSIDAGVESFTNTTHLFACSSSGTPPARQVHTTMYFEHPREWYLGKTEEDRYLYGYDETVFNTGEQDKVKLSDGTEESFNYFN